MAAIRAPRPPRRPGESDQLVGRAALADRQQHISAAHLTHLPVQTVARTQRSRAQADTRQSAREPAGDQSRLPGSGYEHRRVHTREIADEPLEVGVEQFGLRHHRSRLGGERRTRDVEGTPCSGRLPGRGRVAVSRAHHIRSW